MKNSFARIGVMVAVASAIVSAVFTGCTADSAEGLVRSTGIIVEGFYAHPDGGSTLVANTSGNQVSNLALRQSGDQLEGFDNNGIRFAGTIGQVIEGTRASFTLDGRSTSGQPATIAGNIDVDGTTATMTGTWIEPNLASTVYGQAIVPTNTVPPSSTNDTTGVRLNQSLVSISPSGTTSFSASGGTAPYAWRVSNSGLGAITSVSGVGNATATYAASGTGNNQVVVTDSQGGSATATVRQSQSGGGTNPVTLNQTLVTIDALGGTVQFTASGGEGTFSWQVTNPLIGRVTSISGSRNANAVYTASAVGNTSVTVSDATGASASAVIVQEDFDNVFPPIP